MNRSKIRLIAYICCLLFLVGILLPVNVSWAIDCRSYWTAEYKCMEGCGPCPNSSSNAPSIPTVDAGQQLGAQIGQLGAQMFMQALQGPSPEQVAAQQERQRQIAAQQAYAAQQAAIAEQQRQAEIARQKQEMHDRLVSKMKSDDGTSYGIQGLPGIYLNNSPSGDSGQQGLQLMKDDENDAPAPAGNTAVNAPSSGDEVQPNDGKLPLMKDDDNDNAPANTAVSEDAKSAPEGDQTGQKAVNLSGVPIADAHLDEASAGPDFDGRTTGNAPLGSLKPGASASDTGVVDLRGTSTDRVDPGIVNGSSPALAGTKHSDADTALMKHQWEMSIDARYLSDPAVQTNLRRLWQTARGDDDDAADAADAKLKNIVRDQFKAKGLTGQQIDDFFTKYMAIASGDGPVPKEWDRISPLAYSLDHSGAQTDAPTLLWMKSAPYYTDKEELDHIDAVESIKADHVKYMASGKQTEDDCVLYAIANGSGVDVQKVKDEFKNSVSGLAMEEVSDRRDPANMLKHPAEGGRGGTGPVEELLVAQKFGNVVPVPKDSFARAIATTGQPVITTLDVQPPNHAGHKVVVTGVYENKDGKYYYSVMDSTLYNAKTNPESTQYVEKSFFNAHLDSGGFVVLPNDQH